MKKVKDLPFIVRIIMAVFFAVTWVYLSSLVPFHGNILGIPIVWIFSAVVLVGIYYFFFPNKELNR